MTQWEVITRRIVPAATIHNHHDGLLMPNTDIADIHHGCTSAPDGLADRRRTAGFPKAQYTETTHDNGLAWAEALVAAMPWMILLFPFHRESSTPPA